AHSLANARGMSTGAQSLRSGTGQTNRDRQQVRRHFASIRAGIDHRLQRFAGHASNVQGNSLMRFSAFTLSLVFLAVHLAIAAWVPLFDDEAYYALWARDLALGYYDHPPMIAYMIRMGTSLFGETPLGIRMFPVVGDRTSVV